MSDERSVSRRGFLRGAAGATAVAAASGTATGQEGEGGGTPTEGGQAGGGGGGTQTVELVDYAYEPGTDQPLYITPGTTVNFVWNSDNHNIAVDSQPEGANWEGHEPVENSGFEYSHTFETLGEYAFHCDPHLNLGMEGTIVVNEQGAPPQEGSTGPSVPDSAKSIGVATSVALGSTLGLAYLFLKYGGGGEPSE